MMRVYNKYIKGKPYLGISIVPKGQLDLALTGSVSAVVNQSRSKISSSIRRAVRSSMIRTSVLLRRSTAALSRP
ncbi:MAG: hypothetical protein ACLR1G_09910 [Alistipes indistinctus]